MWINHNIHRYLFILASFEIVKKLEKMFFMAQLLSSILCSYERKCLQMENAYNIVNKQDTKLNIQNEHGSVKTQ